MESSTLQQTPEPGGHVARLAGFRPHRSEHGPCVILTFDVRGQQVRRCIGTKCTNTNPAGRIVAGLLGRQLEPGKPVDLRPLISRQFHITIERGNDGVARVADNPPPFPLP